MKRKWAGWHRPICRDFGRSESRDGNSRKEWSSPCRSCRWGETSVAFIQSNVSGLYPLQGRQSRSAFTSGPSLRTTPPAAPIPPKRKGSVMSKKRSNAGKGQPGQEARCRDCGWKTKLFKFHFFKTASRRCNLCGGILDPKRPSDDFTGGTDMDKRTQLAELLAAALDYSRRGFSIIPTRTKKARFSWKSFQSERANPDLVRDWFGGRFTDIDGIAVICGPISGGLAIRDFDKPDAYSGWAGAHLDQAAKLPTVKTARLSRLLPRPGGLQEPGRRRVPRRRQALLPLAPQRSPNRAGLHLAYPSP